MAGIPMACRFFLRIAIDLPSQLIMPRLTAKINILGMEG